MAEGFGTGLIAGSQAAQQEQLGAQQMQMNTLTMQGQKQDLQKGALAIQQTQMMLDRQRDMMLRIQNMNKASATDPAAQAKMLASEALRYGQAAMESNLPEEGFEYIQKGVNLLTNAANLDQMHAEKMKTNATLTGQLMEHVTDARSFQRALMAFQTATGEKSPYADPNDPGYKPYSPELVQHLKDLSQTALQQAEAIKNKAQAASAYGESSLHKAALEKEKIDIERDKLKLEAEKKAGKQLKAADTTALYNQIAGSYTPDASVIKKAIAEEGLNAQMQKLMDDGMSRDDAAVKVFKDAEAKGVFRAKGWTPRHVRAPGATPAATASAQPPSARSGTINRMGGDTQTYQGKTYRLKPGTDRSKRENWEVVSGE